MANGYMRTGNQQEQKAPANKVNSGGIFTQVGKEINSDLVKLHLLSLLTFVLFCLIVLVLLFCPF